MHYETNEQKRGTTKPQLYQDDQIINT